MPESHRPTCYVPPIAALVWTVGTIIAATLMSSAFSSLSVALVTFAAAAFLAANFRPIVTTIKITLPMAIGLVIVHGIINPQFPATRSLSALIPIRDEGLTYATVLSARLCVIAIGFIIWQFTRRTEVFAFFHRIGFSGRGLAMLAVAVTSIDTFARRVRAVQLAQQARGLDLKGNLIARFIGLPRLVVPVVTASLVEAQHRGIIMEHRGFGRNSLVLPSTWSIPPLKPSRLVAAVLPPLAAAVAVCVR